MKKTPRLLFVVLMVLWIVGSVGVAHATLINDPGLESVDTRPIGWTDNYGVWGGEPAVSVGSENGITPFEGEKMLHFLWGNLAGEASPACCSDVFQLIDMSAFSSLVSSGLASASVYFNRVGGDEFTDTLFNLNIRSYNDTPDNVNLFGHQTAVVRGRLLSDSDPSTWEKVSVSLDIPADTVFLALIMFPEENVLNNDTPPQIEFDGHYADAMSFNIRPVPAPATILLLGTGLVGLAGFRRTFKS